MMGLGRKKIVLISIALVCTCLLVVTAFIATRNGPGKPYSQADFDDFVASQNAYFAAQSQQVDQETLLRDADSYLTIQSKVRQYAKDNEISVSDEEVQQLYQQYAEQVGGEQQLLDKINRLYGHDKYRYLETLHYTLLAEKVSIAAGKPITEL